MSNAEPTPSGNTVRGDVWVNAKRWSRKALRSPELIVLEISMAVLSLLLFTTVFGEAGTLALSSNNFGGVGYVSFLLPAVLIQVTMASSFSSGMGLVSEFETGMFDTVLVTPMSWTAVLTGKALAELVRVGVQLLCVLVLGLVMGGTIETGVVGFAGIVAVCLLFAVWYMAVANVLAVVTRDSEVLDAASMLLLFPLLFVSSAFVPVSTLPGWAETVATFNPVTYGVDAVRALALDRDVMTVLAVDRFGGIYDTLVPALSVLLVVTLVTGAIAVWLLSRTGSATVE